MALSLNNLAALYYVQGRYDKAELKLRQALEIWQKSRGAEHPDVAAALNNLGALYKSQGLYDKSGQFYQQAHEILVGRKQSWQQG